MELSYDMDVDLDLDADPIKEFLHGKLEEIKHNNKKLENEITDKHQLLEICKSLSSGTTASCLQITEIWKKVHNDRCVFGIHLRNCGERKPVSVKNVLLNWNSSTFITYKFKIFKLDEENTDENLKTPPSESSEVINESVIVLAIEKPIFFKQIQYDIAGVIIYSEKSSNNKDDQVTISTINIKAKDFTDASLEIKKEDLVDLKTKHFLTCLIAKEEFLIVGKIPYEKSIEDVLHAHCHYKEIKFRSANKLYLIYDISTNINGNLIEVLQEEEGIFTLKMICSGEDSLFQVLNHMFDSIDDLCILPKSHELLLNQSLFSQEVTNVENENRRKLSETLRQEIKLIEQFCKGRMRECSHKNYTNFRSELDQLQLQADILYSKCSNV